jgi:hypothetical protein
MYLKLFVKRFLFKRMFKIAHVFQLEMWITPKSLLFSGCSLLFQGASYWYFLDVAYSRENEVCSPKVRNFFHPKDQTKIYLLPGPRKRLFSRSHPEKCQRHEPYFFWIYKLNTSLVQIPAIAEYFASRASKKIIFEVTL